MGDLRVQALKCVSDALHAGLVERNIQPGEYDIAVLPLPNGGIRIAIRNAKGESIAGSEMGPIVAWNAPTEAKFTALGRELAARVEMNR